MMNRFGLVGLPHRLSPLYRGFFKTATPQIETTCHFFVTILYYSCTINFVYFSFFIVILYIFLQNTRPAFPTGGSGFRFHPQILQTYFALAIPSKSESPACRFPEKPLDCAIFRPPIPRLSQQDLLGCHLLAEHSVMLHKQHGGLEFLNQHLNLGAGDQIHIVEGLIPDIQVSRLAEAPGQEDFLLLPLAEGLQGLLQLGTGEIQFP